MKLSENRFQILVLILAAIAMYLVSPSVSRSISGLLFVLFIPGFISTYAFFRKDEIDWIERIAFSIGLSISFVVLTIMFSNLYLDIPITTTTIVLQISALCAFFGLIIALKRSRAVMSVYTGIINVLMLRTGNPKRTLNYLAPVVIILLLTLNIGYPLIFTEPQDQYRNDDVEYIKYNYIDHVFDTAKGLRVPRPHTINFENGLVFLGHDIKRPIRRGKKVHIDYYFKSNKDMTVHGISIVTDFGITDTVFQNHISFPSIKLKEGEILLISNDVTIPKEISQGIYTMHLSLLKGYTYLKTDDSNEIGKINVPWYFDELFNQSMDIQMFYNGRNISVEKKAISQPRVYVFENKIAFLGYDMNPNAVSRGQNFRITYWWKSLDTVKKDYTVFVHFIDSNGKIVFQHDHKPPVPTSEWALGDIISEKYDVCVPSHVNESTYRIRFGLYDASTGKRVALSSRSTRNNAPYLGQITVRQKHLSDYYTKNMNVRIINTIDNTSFITKNMDIPNPVTIDYGPLAILGYDLGALRTGKTANLTYFIKASDVSINYSIRTLITDTEGPGLIAFDSVLPSMTNGEIIALIVPVAVPHNYGASESLFTFGLRNKDTGEYFRSAKSVFERVEIMN